MRMKTGILLSCLLILIVAWPANAQSGSKSIQLDATGEYRTAASDSIETGNQLAVVIARRSVLISAMAGLRNDEAMKAVRLKPGQLEAFIPAILEIESSPVQTAKQGNATTHRVSVTVRLEPTVIARRLDKLRTDPNAAEALMEVSKQAETLYPLLSEARTAKEQDVLEKQLRANLWMAQAYAAIAKIEESPASNRVSSSDGRQRALQLAESAVQLEPSLPEAHLLHGDVLTELSQIPMAESAYRQAVSLAPTSSRAHVKLADALRQGGKTPGAVAELREAIRIDPNSAIAHSDLGFVLDDRRSAAESMTEYREAIRLDPDLVEAHNYLAIALARQGKFPEAVDEFREIVRIDAESVLGYYNMAIALADMEKDAESAEALRSAVHYNPNHYNAHYNLGELFRLEEKYDEAVTQFKVYLRLAPATPQSQRNIQRATEFVRTHENP